MIALLALPAALAAPSAVQVRLFDDALDVAADLVEEMDPVLAEDDLGAEVSCWDRVGIRDFNLDVPIDLVGLSPGDDTLTLYVGMGDITGSDMVLYAEDEEWTDACGEFELDVYSVAVRNAELVATLQLTPDGDGFATTFFSAPLVTADLESDLEYVPDEEALAFFEDTLLDLVAEQLELALPPLLDEALAQAAVQGDYDDYAVDFTLTDVDLQPGSLGLAADGAIDFVGRPACAVPPDPGQPSGRAVTLPLDGGPGAAMGVGLTEAFVADLLHTGWRSGAFCFGSESAAVLAERLALVVDPSFGTFEVQASLGAPPVLSAGSGGMRLSLDDLDLVVIGRSDEGSAEIVTARIDLSADAAVGFAPSLTALTLSLSNLDVTFEELSLSRIVPGYEDHVRPMLEQHLARWLQDEMQQIPVMSSLYYAYGLAIAVERAEPVDGGVEVWLDLLLAGDLNQVPPETEITDVVAGRTSAEVAWSGEDDESEPLVWSWQLDDGPWSAWTDQRSAELWALSEGAHVVRVKARDVWLNEDPSPAESAFEISADNAKRGGESCTGCASRGLAGGGWAAGLVLAIGLVRRRQTVTSSPDVKTGRGGEA